MRELECSTRISHWDMRNSNFIIAKPVQTRKSRGMFMVCASESSGANVECSYLIVERELYVISFNAVYDAYAVRHTGEKQLVAIPPKMQVRAAPKWRCAMWQPMTYFYRKSSTGEERMRMESCMKMRYTMCVGQNLIMSRTELVGMEIIIDEIEMTTICNDGDGGKRERDDANKFS